MTARPTCTCGVDLEGMRLARAEDHKACARLAARVKELEAEVGKLQSVAEAANRLVCEVEANGRDYFHTREELAGAVAAWRGAPGSLRRLAEGTRDETVRRCTRCNCSVDPSEPAAVTFCRVCILAVAAEAVR